MKDAGRKVEDILAPENEDATLEVSRLELADLRADLALYQEVKNANGEIRAEHGGMVTDIFITTGGRTSDSAVMLLADDSVPCQFKTTLTQEQKKYVGLSDTVSLKLDGSSKEKEAVIDYLAESSSAPGSYGIHQSAGRNGGAGDVGHDEPCRVGRETALLCDARRGDDGGRAQSCLCGQRAGRYSGYGILRGAGQRADRGSE